MAGQSSFPESIDNYTEVQDGISVIQADDVNDGYAALNAIETFLGNSGANQSHNTDVLQYLLGFQDPATRVRVEFVDGGTLRATAGVLLCRNSDESIRKLRKNSTPVDITFADIDTGSEQANKKYYVIAVADAATSTLTFKLSLSKTAPTGVTTFWVVASAWNNGSSNFEEASLSNESDPNLPKDYLSGAVIKNHATNGKITIEATVVRDDSDQANMAAPEFTKDVGSNFSEGDNGGLLDAGSVSTGLYHFFIISGDDKSADYICSSSTSPTMPSGYDKKRWIGSRYHNGTDWVDFVTSGEGREKWTWLFDHIVITTSNSGSFTDASVATWVRAGKCKLIHIFGKTQQGSTAGVSIFIRAKGSTQATGTSTRFGNDHDDQNGPGNPDHSSAGLVPLDNNGVFQYANSGSIQLTLTAFKEDL